MTTNDQMRHVYEPWDRAIVGRNLNKLMALYANDSVLGSSAVLVLEKDPSKIVRGRDRTKALRELFRERATARTGTARNNSFGRGSRWSGNTKQGARWRPARRRWVGGLGKRHNRLSEPRTHGHE